ncbi:MAG: sulfoxide reductase heme-binding subunit YedZ [Chloroflexi bacterium]|nr:sulfoxide reductase heme-binding subunit YedZ [Chloroflexota bacterium]
MKKRFSKVHLITLLISVVPAGVFLFNYIRHAYDPYPTLFLTQFSARTALLFLLVSLACTPLRNMLGMSALLKVRKITGLAAFYYALLHTFTFIVLDYQLNLNWLIPEFRDKPYLLLGLAALVLLIPLALTSGERVQVRLGKIWKRIHRLVYLIGLLVLVHQYFAIKGDKSSAVVYMMVYGILMLLRLPLIRDTLKIKSCTICHTINQWLIS